MSEKDSRKIEPLFPCAKDQFVYELWVDPRRNLNLGTIFIPSWCGTYMCHDWHWMELRVNQAPRDTAIFVEQTQDFLARPDAKWEDKTGSMADAAGEIHDALTQFPGIFTGEFFCAAVRLRVVVATLGPLEIWVGRSKFVRKFDDVAAKNKV